MNTEHNGAAVSAEAIITEAAPIQNHGEPMRSVEIWTDGSCSPNPGLGGWAALLRSDKGAEQELSNHEYETTNSRIEMMAAIKALEWLKQPRRVKLHTDSDFVFKGMTIWLRGWKDKGWLGSDKKPVKNQDLWERLEAATARHEVEWIRVRGHSGHPENERVDRLAKAAITKARRRA